MNNPTPDLAGVWDAYCASLQNLGRSVLDEAGTDQDRAEAIRALARLTAMTLTQQLDFSDPTNPRFFRSNDDVWQWGGPNVDNVYLGAAIDPSLTYRLTGCIADQPGAILQVLGQPTSDDPVGVRVNCPLTERANEAGQIDLVLGPATDTDDDRIVVPADARRLILREYVPSADAKRANFILDRQDASEPALPLTEAGVVRSLTASQRWLEHSIPFWRDYTRSRRDEIGNNQLEAPSTGGAMGSDTILYSTGFFSLETDEALLITIDEPEARYWALQLYTMDRYEGIDPTDRQSSLNHTEAVADADGRVRFVITGTDAGTANWLDTGGHQQGMIHFRAVWNESTPEVATEVVKVAELATHLPAEHPMVSPVERAEALGRRRRNAQQRFVR